MSISRRLQKLEDLLPAGTPEAAAIDAEALAFACSDAEACTLLDRLGERLASIGRPLTYDDALADPAAARLLGDFARRVQTRGGAR